MPDFDDLRAFEKVVSQRSFTSAARVLGVAKSSISRSIGRIEAEFGVRLFQRTTREVVLTEVGAALQSRFGDILMQFDQALDFTASLSVSLQGQLKVTCGIGFGLNVLAELIPQFARRYPGIQISLELTSRSVDLVGEGLDVAIRMGPLQDSRLMSTHLGVIAVHLCAAPSYLERRGTPGSLDDLRNFDLIEMPRAGGRRRNWTFSDASGTKVEVDVSPHISANDPYTIHRLVLNGAGIGCLARYLCTPEIEGNRLIRLFPDWTLPSVDVSLVFPSARELAPTIRAFVEFMRSEFRSSHYWLDH